MAAKKATRKPKPRVVTAVGVSANAGENIALAEKIEAAMSAAVVDMNKRGVNDPDKIRAAMLAARDKALAE
jgi:Ni,Fe-hydrogenase III small subunit